MLLWDLIIRGPLVWGAAEALNSNSENAHTCKIYAGHSQPDPQSNTCYSPNVACILVLYYLEVSYTWGYSKYSNWDEL